MCSCVVFVCVLYLRFGFEVWSVEFSGFPYMRSAALVQLAAVG